MNLVLNDVNHLNPDDIDILLVGPQGQRITPMSDVGGTGDAVDVDLTLDDEAAAPLPDTAQLVSGSFQPFNSATVDTFPAPAPSPNGVHTLSVFDSTNPNGTWSLYVYDDLASNGGSIGSWDLTITTGPAPPPNCGPEMHIDAATATVSSPYPSNCTISGLGASITDVNLVLDGVYHTFPDDLDLLLVGPQGQNAIVTSDAGGLFDVNDVDLTLDDEAGAPIPDSTQITSGCLPAGQLHAGRHLARSGAGSERRQCPLGLRRHESERGLEPVRVRRRVR